MVRGGEEKEEKKGEGCSALLTRRWPPARAVSDFLYEPRRGGEDKGGYVVEARGAPGELWRGMSGRRRMRVRRGEGGGSGMSAPELKDAEGSCARKQHPYTIGGPKSCAHTYFLLKEEGPGHLEGQQKEKMLQFIDPKPGVVLGRSEYFSGQMTYARRKSFYENSSVCIWREVDTEGRVTSGECSHEGGISHTSAPGDIPHDQLHHPWR
jgi:hypothetical protein